MANDERQVVAIPHDEMEKIKVTVTMDGDLAASISNAIRALDENDAWGGIAFCGHSLPKIKALYDQIGKELNIQTEAQA